MWPRCVDAAPHTIGTGFAANDLAILGAWALGGLAVALWRFRWVPNS